MASVPVGLGQCPNCGKEVTFRRSAGGLLNFKHDFPCASSGYCEPGSDTHAKWSKTIKPFTADPAPAPAGDPTPPPAPAPARKKASVFELGAL